mgnify:CR=1 FL=1
MKRRFLNALILCLLATLKCLAVPEGVTIKNYVYAEKYGQQLTLDVYNDPSNNTYKKKPVFIFSFGGSWEAGNRQAGHALLTDFAEEGYIAVGIDYRLHIRNLKDLGVKLDKTNFCQAYAKAIEMGIEDLFDELDFSDKEFDDDNATVGGWAVEMLGGYPKLFDSFVYEDLTVTVLKKERMRILRLSVERNPDWVDEEEEE